MKKVMLLLAVALCSVSGSFAQDKKVRVTGNVTDYETAEPVGMATVQLLALPDSSFKLGATTDEKGRFELDDRLQLGNYLVKVSFVGYGDEHRTFTVADDTRRVRFDSIRLKTDALLLKEAVIEAQMAQVQVVDDTVAFNAEAFRVPEGSMLEELIRKLPGYEVGDDGTVTYNGQTVSKILVDGKEFFSNDKSIAMKNLPANMVKKIKSYIINNLFNFVNLFYINRFAFSLTLYPRKNNFFCFIRKNNFVPRIQVSTVAARGFSIRRCFFISIMGMAVS